MTEEIEIIDEREPSALQNPDNLTWGIALIVVGIVYLLDTLGIVGLRINNWWAIFILVPGINLLTRAWFYTRESGTFSGRASRSALWGSVLVLLSFTYFFDLDITLMFPFILIGSGLYLLLSR